MKLRFPDLATVYLNGKTIDFGGSTVYERDGVYVSLKENTEGLLVQATATGSPLRFVKLRWNLSGDEKRKESVRILGDAWERGYGDLEWRGYVPDRFMPWYFAVSDGSDSNRDFSGRFTECFGVKVRPSALCFWQYDPEGITLWMDLRNGGNGVEPDGRIIDAAVVVFGEYRDMSAFDAISKFCHVMCTDPLTTENVVYGSNNWYYAYGKSSFDEIISDTKFVKSLTDKCENIPYMVIDDGWEPNVCDAPWDRGNERFPDMKRLAEEMSDIGVRPGIWIRYLSDINRQTPGISDEWRLQRDNQYLDPSHPAVLEHVRNDTQRILNWGYKLIKHDYSTFDIFGKWGIQIQNQVADDGWGFYDRTKTSAEIVLNFYRTIYESAPDTVIIGCNCISHLCAGLVHINRTGDDTSGILWSKTRKLGVNTLAFRLAQNNAFYGADADCVGITEAIPWEQNRLWLKALANSNSPFFVSCKPGILDQGRMQELKEAFKIASKQDNKLVPVDWMENIFPERWELNGNEIHFNWYSKEGIDNFIPKT